MPSSPNCSYLSKSLILFNTVLKIHLFFSLLFIFWHYNISFQAITIYIFLVTIIPSFVSFMLYPLLAITFLSSSDFAQSLFALASFLSSISFFMSSGISSKLIFSFCEFLYLVLKLYQNLITILQVFDFFHFLQLPKQHSWLQSYSYHH